MANPLPVLRYGLRMLRINLSSTNEVRFLLRCLMSGTDETIDVRPPPKAHFAAHQPAAPKLAPAVLQPISAAASSSRLSFSYAPNIHAPRPSRTGGPRSSLVGPGPRRSGGVGVKARPSKVPRLSVSGAAAFQPFALPNIGEGSGSSLAALSEKEIDERVRGVSFVLGTSETNKLGCEQIAKAVEAEVARRLEEREKEQERLKGEQEQQAAATVPDTSEPSVRYDKETLPPGVLTPLLKRHRDLDDELKLRLHELERKLYVFF
jgi:kinesin family member 22